MKNSLKQELLHAMLAVITLTFATLSLNAQTQPNSANVSRGSATRASDALVKSCSAVAIELEAARELITTLEDENKSLDARLATEREANGLLTELSATRKSESEALRSALAAKDEALAAKQDVITAQDRLLAELKMKKRSALSRITDILIGAGAALILR